MDQATRSVAANRLVCTDMLAVNQCIARWIAKGKITEQGSVTISPRRPNTLRGCIESGCTEEGAEREKLSYVEGKEDDG